MSVILVADLQKPKLLEGARLGGGERVPVCGKEGQQKVGRHLAHVEGDGPVGRELGVDGVRGVLGDHPAPRVQVPVQQRLLPLNK